MADWNNPTLASTKVDVLTGLKDREVDAYTLAESPTNPPTGAIRYARSSNKFQEWSGSAWVDKVLSVEGGGTGASNISGARATLGLGTLSTQNSNAVSISGGTITGLSSFGVLGNATIGGLLIVGSGPTTLTNSAGQILETSIVDGTVYPRCNSISESITGTWTFVNPVNATIVNGVTTNTGQIISARKQFSAAQSSAMGVNVPSLGGIEITGDGTNAAFLAFHRPGSAGYYFGVDTDNQFKVGGWTAGANAAVLLHAANYNAYAPTLIGTGASGTWNINVLGSSASLSSNIVINGVPVNAGSSATIACAAGTLTGATLAAGVTASSLTSLGTITNLTVGNGSAASPAVRFIGSTGSGLYYNPTGSTVEFGANFASDGRSVIRARSDTSEIDFLIATTIPLTVAVNSVTVAGNLFVVGDVEVSGALDPGADNAYFFGNGLARWKALYSVNGTIQTSDIRHKRNHGAIENALQLIRKTETFIASWIHGTEQAKFPALSAQNIHEVMDDELGTEIVVIDQFDGHAMYYNRIIPILLAAVKELDAEVQRLRTI